MINYFKIYSSLGDEHFLCQPIAAFNQPYLDIIKKQTKKLFIYEMFAKRSVFMNNPFVTPGINKLKI